MVVVVVLDVVELVGSGVGVVVVVSGFLVVVVLGSSVVVDIGLDVVVLDVVVVTTTVVVGSTVVVFTSGAAVVGTWPKVGRLRTLNKIAAIKRLLKRKFMFS